MSAHSHHLRHSRCGSACVALSTRARLRLQHLALLLFVLADVTGAVAYVADRWWTMSLAQAWCVGVLAALLASPAALWLVNRVFAGMFPVERRHDGRANDAD